MAQWRRGAIAVSTSKAEAFFDGVRPWQWIKHTVLKDYFVPWAAKLGSIAPEIWVVDAFAGAGVYQGSDGATLPGSPLLAAECAREFNERRPGRKMRVLCIERNRRICESLRRNVEPYGDAVEVVRGDFVTSVPLIKETIGTSPALILLDPFGPTAVRADACRDLLDRSGQTDVFVMAMLTFVPRAAGQIDEAGNPRTDIPGASALKDGMDAFFGTDEWLPIAKGRNLDEEERARRLISLYFDRVVPDRYLYRSAFPVRPQPGRPPKYWIVHLSRHPDGFWLMNDEIAKVGAQLERRYDDDPLRLPGMADSLAESRARVLDSELDDAIVRILETEPTRSLTFGELKRRALPQFFGRVKSGAYGKSVKRLVRAGAVERVQRLAARIDDAEPIALLPRRLPGA